jgi:hypothetical protein
MKNYLLLLGVCFVLASCSTGDAVNGTASTSSVGGSSQALVFLDCRAVSDDEIEFKFSGPVTVKHLNFEPELSVASIENGSTVRVKLNISPPLGTLFTADLVAEDEKRNTINVLVPFRARNSRMPELEINEFRTEYSNTNGRYRGEFVEFKTKTEGNLGAMRVFMAGGSQTPTVYEFVPIEVKKGEYITLHMRKGEAACKDELTDDLAESGGTDSSPTGRDLWIPSVTKRINKTGFIYVLDQDDNVLSAIMFSERPDAWWGKDYLAEAAEFLYRKGAWTSPEGNICTPKDAIPTIGTTATRTINRDETVDNTNTAADWYITDTSKLSPGARNNPERYVPK